MGKKKPKKAVASSSIAHGSWLLFAQFFFHVSMLALEPYSIMPFIKKTMRGSFFWVSFNYCFISLLKYVQRFEFALENARSELGYSAIYILLLALRSCCCVQGRLW